jgi:hypothetical protein
MTLPSNPNDRQKLKMAIGEITNCLLRMDSEREAMKEIIGDASKKYEVDKKMIRKIATTMYKSNYADVQAENEEFELMYESLVEGRKDVEEAA